jgi:hypothetical protein
LAAIFSGNFPRSLGKITWQRRFARSLGMNRLPQFDPRADPPSLCSTAFVPSSNAWAHAQFAGTPGASRYFTLRITCVELVEAGDDFVCEYFQVISS